MCGCEKDARVPHGQSRSTRTQMHPINHRCPTDSVHVLRQPSPWNPKNFDMEPGRPRRGTRARHRQTKMAPQDRRHKKKPPRCPVRLTTRPTRVETRETLQDLGAGTGNRTSTRQVCRDPVPEGLRQGIDKIIAELQGLLRRLPNAKVTDTERQVLHPEGQDQPGTRTRRELRDDKIDTDQDESDVPPTPTKSSFSDATSSTSRCPRPIPSNPEP